MERHEIAKHLDSFGEKIDKAVSEEILSTRCLFSNGNIEFFLKSMLFSYIDFNLEKENHSYCMDKKINKHQFDVIGFKDLEIAYTVETKCTIIHDVKGSISAANKAKEQALKNSQKYKHKDYPSRKSVNHYIIHFLMLESGANSDFFPPAVRAKFPTQRPLAIARSKLSETYREIDKECGQEIMVVKGKISAFLAKV